MLQKVAIKNLRPNPFRRLEEYPIQREKVEALKLSIFTSNFWTSIIARPAGKGTFEIAFGHHRLVALTELYEADDEVEIIVRDLSNEDMIRMMANENMAEWGSDGWVEVETIRATIDAYGKGLITLPSVPKDVRKDLIRYVSRNSDSRAYTMGTVAQFLGWTRINNGDRLRPDTKCECSFCAIDAMEASLIKSADLKGMPRYKIHELCRSVLRIHEENEAKAQKNREAAEAARKQAEVTASTRERERFERQAEVCEQQAKQHASEAKDKANRFVNFAAPRLRNHAKNEAREALLEVRELAQEMVPMPTKKRMTVTVCGLADKLADHLETIANGEDRISKDVQFLKEWKGDLSAHSADQLRKSFSALITRLERTCDVVRSLSGSHSEG